MLCHAEERMIHENSIIEHSVFFIYWLNVLFCNSVGFIAFVVNPRILRERHIMKIIRTFNINPIPASRPRVTRYATFYSKAYTEFRKDFKELVEAKRVLMVEGALSMTMLLTVKMPKSWTKKKKAEHKGTYHTQTPDSDNYAKAIMDSLNGYYYADDAQVSVMTVVKKWGDNGSIQVKIEELDQVDRVHENQSTIYDYIKEY